MLLVMLYGCSLALLITMLGATSLFTEGTGVVRDERLPLQSAGNAQLHDHASHDHSNGDHGRGQSTAPRMRVKARHLGNLTVDITAEVTLNQQRRALTQAQVVAAIDMMQMPGAHKQGPVPLHESGIPGTYKARIDVPMPGDYQVRVTVKEPVRGTRTLQLPVGTTY